ncbi:MAG: hypothetical protein WCT31_02950, partial [Candidatus Micrarchaeia archaeon]
MPPQVILLEQGSKSIPGVNGLIERAFSCRSAHELKILQRGDKSFVGPKTVLVSVDPFRGSYSASGQYGDVAALAFISSAELR